MHELILIPLFVFACLALLIFAAYFYFRERNRKKALLGKIEEFAKPDLKQEFTEAKAKSAPNNLFTKVAANLAQFSQPKSEEEIILRKNKLTMAGYRQPGHLKFFYGLKVFLAVLLPATLAVAHLFAELFERGGLFMAFLVAAALLGFYLPDFWIRYAIKVRQEKIRLGFPDALDLLVVCVEAGMGLDQAIKRIADEMRIANRVISDEFGLMGLEMRAGRSRRDALHNLAERTGVEDVRSLVSLLIQTDKFGTSIAQALRVHSDSMRIKRRQRAEEMATKLPVKMLFPLILFIFPALFVVIVGPAIIRVYRSIIGIN